MRSLLSCQASIIHFLQIVVLLVILASFSMLIHPIVIRPNCYSHFIIFINIHFWLFYHTLFWSLPHNHFHARTLWASSHRFPCLIDTQSALFIYIQSIPPSFCIATSYHHVFHNHKYIHIDPVHELSGRHEDVRGWDRSSQRLPCTSSLCMLKKTVT